jgi:hypothetical protein
LTFLVKTRQKVLTLTLTNTVTLMAKRKIRLAAEPAPNVTPIVAVMAKHNAHTLDLEVFLTVSIK